jgi:hypothetical protein
LDLSKKPTVTGQQGNPIRAIFADQTGWINALLPPAMKIMIRPFWLLVVGRLAWRLPPG